MGVDQSLALGKPMRRREFIALLGDAGMKVL
jgi:hypothetical protein